MQERRVRWKEGGLYALHLCAPQTSGVGGNQTVSQNRDTALSLIMVSCYQPGSRDDHKAIMKLLHMGFQLRTKLSLCVCGEGGGVNKGGSTR